jgi:hypothetical protein
VGGWVGGGGGLKYFWTGEYMCHINTYGKDVLYIHLIHDFFFVHYIFSSPGNHEFYRLQAANEDEAVEWMRCIQASIQQDSVYDAFNQRKRRITSVQGLELPGFD